MKKAIQLLIAVIAFNALFLSTGCKKDKKNAPNNPKGTYSFSNSEYTGIARVGNHYYPRPLSLRFGAKDSVIAWSHLTLTKWRRGDVPGKITKVEEDAQGQTQVTVLFDLPGDEQFNSPQVYTISADKSKITGGSSPIIAMVDMKLFPKDAPSIVGNWGQPDHPEWFPDVNSTTFYTQGLTSYFSGGDPLYSVHDDGVIFKLNYKQDGSRILFSGANPIDPEIYVIPYYGVLSADGNTLYVDPYEFTAARITTSLSTFEWYGPKGVTPWLLRK
ncbi:hypothetical protein GCM10023149_08320 [Mucilaginibacter gynuensis]|uniref:Glycosyl hydrolase family 43 n=1 Tax=Mucilaginibacter gynuensis TaxID=1302236 RepID=A0ABP8FX62_9SPHI